MNKKLTVLLCLVVLAGLLLGACQPAPAPTPEKPGEPAPVTPEVTLPYIPADKMVACLPLPEVAYGTGGPTYAAATEQLVAAQAAAKVFGKPVASLPEQAAEVIYKVGVFEDVTTVNYWAANGPDNTVWNAYMLPQRLTLFGLSDQNFTFVPAAAKDLPEPLKQEGDFWVVEIPIREDIKWSDGEPFTAEDVAFTANSVLRLGLISGNWANWYDADFIEKLEAVGPYTVKYVFHTKPGLARYQYGVLGAPVVAKHYWETVVNEAAKPIEALAAGASEEDTLTAKSEAQKILFSHVPDGEPSAGAYTFGTWEEGAFLEVTKSESYFDAGVKIELWADGSYRSSTGFEYVPPEGAPETLEGEPETVIEIGPHTDGVLFSYYGS
ncbi:MAG: ABC transporter substrate-binding protein [Anaerolineaceae bacterium]|nr:ABC transporter substrate-binding protein [Anaerolineaceae bacterium]